MRVILLMLHVHRELKRRKVAGTRGMLHELGGAVIGPRCLPSIWVLPFVCDRQVGELFGMFARSLSWKSIHVCFITAFIAY